MKKHIPTFTLAFFLIALSGCMTVGPISIPDDHPNEIRSVGLISILADPPTASYLGKTAFGNKTSEMSFSEFNINDFIESKLEELLGTDYRIVRLSTTTDGAALREEYKESKSLKGFDSITKRFSGTKLDAILIVHQGDIRRGLAPEAGAWFNSSGTFLNNTFFEKSDYVVMPSYFSLIDTKTSEEIATSGSAFRNNCFIEIDDFGEDLDPENMSHLEQQIIIRGFDRIYEEKIKPVIESILL